MTYISDILIDLRHVDEGEVGGIKTAGITRPAGATECESQKLRTQTRQTLTATYRLSQKSCTAAHMPTDREAQDICQIKININLETIR